MCIEICKPDTQISPGNSFRQKRMRLISRRSLFSPNEEAHPGALDAEHYAEGWNEETSLLPFVPARWTGLDRWRSLRTFPGSRADRSGGSARHPFTFTGKRRPKADVKCAWCDETFETSQPEHARYCSDAHRIYAWRDRKRASQAGSGIPVNDEFVTARAVTN